MNAPDTFMPGVHRDLPAERVCAVCGVPLLPPPRRPPSRPPASTCSNHCAMVLSWRTGARERITPEAYIARFRSKFAVTHSDAGCWEWTASRQPGGYGQVIYNGRVTRAHRVAYLIFVGPIPPGMFVCHRCDNRACVNPAHLFLGTHNDNMRDAVSKGRMSRQGKPGESNGRAKLTRGDVSEIRLRVAQGATQISLARLYGVGPTAISRIIKGRSWTR